MQYTIYVLLSAKDNKRYIGYTSNLELRFKEHMNGLVKSTKYRRPLNIIYKEIFDNKSDALAREKFFKSGQGRKFLQSVGA